LISCSAPVLPTTPHGGERKEEGETLLLTPVRMSHTPNKT